MIDAICRYAKRSDVKAFRNMVLQQPGVIRVLHANKLSIEQSFLECVQLNERGKGLSSTCSKTTNNARETVTTLTKFEQWLDMIGKGESRGGKAFDDKGKSWHKLPGLGKRKAREIFGHVQRLDWHDGTVSTMTDDLEMNLMEFEEALVAIALHVDPDPFRAIDQRVECGLEKILGIEDY